MKKSSHPINDDMRIKKIVTLVGTFLLLTSYIFSCERVKDDAVFARKIEKDIEDSARQGRVFSFDAYDDFPWTDLYIINPYITIEDIDEIDLWEIDRGILSGLHHTDHNQCLVFKNGKEVVKCILIAPSRIYAEQSYCILSKKETVFDIKTREGDGYMYLDNKKCSSR